MAAVIFLYLAGLNDLFVFCYLRSGGRFSVSSSPTCRNVSNISGVKTRCSAYLYVNGALDYESMPRHSIIVRATDDHGLFHVREFTVTVLDQNDRPANVTLQGSFTGQVKENRNDEMIGELVTSDEDTSQSHSYTLKNSSNSRFILKGNRLFTTLTADLDYEQQQEFEIVVASTDDGKPRKTVVQRLTIQVSWVIVLLCHRGTGSSSMYCTSIIILRRGIVVVVIQFIQ